MMSYELENQMQKKRKWRIETFKLLPEKNLTVQNKVQNKGGGLHVNFWKCELFSEYFELLKMQNYVNFSQ